MYFIAILSIYLFSNYFVVSNSEKNWNILLLKLMCLFAFSSYLLLGIFIYHMCKYSLILLSAYQGVRNVSFRKILRTYVHCFFETAALGIIS